MWAHAFCLNSAACWCTAIVDMDHYTLLLRNDKARFYRIMTWITLVANAAMFLMGPFLFTGTLSRVSSIVCGGIVAGAVMIHFMQTRANRAVRIPLLPFFGLLSIQWCVLGYYWVAVLPLVFAFLASVADRKFEVIVNTNGVVYPSFPERRLRWEEISNMLVRDGLLTIDLHNNHFYQQLLDEEHNPVNEQEFNDFCRRFLRA